MSATNAVKKVLFLGQQPETVDFSDPALPPGLDAGQIQAGIAAGMNLMTERGWEADLLLIKPDGSAIAELEHALYGSHYDCVVVGAGLRIPTNSLLLFESLINVIHQDARTTAIAFNTSPSDTANAAARWIG